MAVGIWKPPPTTSTLFIRTYMIKPAACTCSHSPCCSGQHSYFVSEGKKKEKKPLSFSSLHSMTMNPVILFVLSFLVIQRFFFQAEPAQLPSAQITVMGFVYCDVCRNNTFSKHSYYMPSAEVQIDCSFKAYYPKTKEQIQFSVNRTTDKYGIYRLLIPSVDGIECADAAIISLCRASLVGTSSKTCNSPGYRSTTSTVVIKSRHPNVCIYTFNALNFRPPKKDPSLCGNKFR